MHRVHVQSSAQCIRDFGVLLPPRRLANRALEHRRSFDEVILCVLGRIAKALMLRTSDTYQRLKQSQFGHQQIVQHHAE